MKISPQQMTIAIPARSVAPVGAPDMRKPFASAQAVEAFDFTGSQTFPIETLIS